MSVRLSRGQAGFQVEHGNGHGDLPVADGVLVEAGFEGGEEAGFIGGVYDGAPAKEEADANEEVAEEGAAIQKAHGKLVLDDFGRRKARLFNEGGDGLGCAPVGLVDGEAGEILVSPKVGESLAKEGVELVHVSDEVGGEDEACLWFGDTGALSEDGVGVGEVVNAEVRGNEVEVGVWEG
jgi:hypothetical protein